MNFLEILINNKKNILKEWFLATISSYPSATSKFLKNQKDPFANPVGQTTMHSLEGLLDGLISGVSTEKIILCVDPIVRIRTVQNFKPSEAVSFIFDLKGIVRRFSCTEKDCCEYFDDLVLFNDRIDFLAMITFDIYMVCKEQIYELKANESRNQFFSSLSRAGLIVET